MVSFKVLSIVSLSAIATPQDIPSASEATAAAGDIDFTTLGRRFNNMQAMFHSIACGDDLGCKKNFKDKISDYGCFCFPGGDSQVRASNNEPVDAIDALCQTLHRAWTCIEMDAGMNDYNLEGACHRDAISNGYARYKWFSEEVDGARTVVCGTEENRNYERTANNRPEVACKLRACQVEKAFVENLIAMDFENVWDKLNVGMVEGGECADPPKGLGVADMCCGEYPTRMPHSSADGDRECCGTSGYAYSINGNTECCDDGTVKIFGGCQIGEQI